MTWGCKGRIVLFLLSAALLFSSSVAAQTLEKGAISGTVYDPTGAVVPNAAVKVTHVATGAEREVTTGPTGRYSFPLLSVGEYTIEVSASGFATAIVQKVRLRVGQELIQDVTLQLAAMGEEIVVTAESGPIDKSEALQKTVINETYVEQLPISGRDFRNFAALSSTADLTPGLRSPIRLGGQFGEYTGFVVDGVDNRNSFFGEWFGSLETKNFTVPQDAIREFQVRDTGFSAEFGHATGGMINVATKSGTNEWHGTLHWFFMSDDTVSNASVPAFPGTVIPPEFDTRHQFGGTVGGPLARDKAFLFFGIDAQQQKGPLSTTFATDVSGVPVPEFGIADLSDLEGVVTQKQDLLTPLIRFDWNLSARNTATTRLNYTRNETNNFTGGRSQTFVVGGVESNFEDFVNEGWVISQSLTTVINPFTVNEFRFAFSREKRPRRQKGPGPETVIFGTGNFGQRFFLPIDSDHKRFQFIDNFSRTFGKHDLKLGVDLNSNGNGQVFIGFAAGQYNFLSLADFTASPRITGFLLQLVGINGFDAIESGTLDTFWQHELSFYVQDSWKIHPRLTLNLGLRWDGVWNPNPEFPIVGNLVPVGKPRRNSDGSVTLNLAPVPQGIPDDFNNWAPRVGAAWDVAGNGKSIVRGGIGLYYAALPSIFMANILNGTGFRSCGALFVPFFGPTDLFGFGLTYPDLLPSRADPTLQALFPPCEIRYADPDFESARVLNIQLGFEQEIVRDLSISFTYSYNRGDELRIGGFWNSTNDRNIGCLVTSGCTISGNSLTIPASEFDQFGRAIDAFNVSTAGPRLPIDPTIGDADALTSFGKSRYHAFMLQVKKTFSHRHQFGINYTVSKNEDNVSNDRDTDAYFAPSDPFNFLTLDFGRSQLDIRHQFRAYASILAPGDIWVSTIVSARSGRAFPAYQGFCSAVFTRFQDCSGLGLFNQIRPVVGSKVLERYPFRNSDLFNWDLRLGRDFNVIGERGRLRVTFEIFNVADTDNAFSFPLAGSNAILGDPTFKQQDTPMPIGAGGPIATQFGLKFIF